jgi:ATP-dependent RNA helicase DDX1
MDPNQRKKKKKKKISQQSFWLPQTVDFAFVWANPKEQGEWRKPVRKIETDGIHRQDHVSANTDTPEMWSEAVKILKPLLLVKIIDAYKMDQCMIFCRTRLDCDHLETFLKGLSAKKGLQEKKKKKKNLFLVHTCF